MTKSGSSIEVTSAAAIEHILQHRPHRIRSLAVSRTGNRNQKLVELAQSQGIRVERLSREGVLARLPAFEYANLEPFLEGLPSQAIVLVLDHLKDPQNLGALCRSADALGVSGVIIPKDRGVLVGPGVYHASVGAVETIPIIKVTNLSATLEKMKEHDFWHVGTSLEGEGNEPWKLPDLDRVTLVMGAEFEGMSRKLAEKCDWQARIPLKGAIPSFNVSAAGAILLYELVRRQASRKS